MNALMGRVAFGYGLGDVVFYLILWAVTVTYLIGFLINRSKDYRLLITNLLLGIPSIWIILTATIWRGSEHRWDGNILFIPCQKEISIENSNRKRKVKLQMCTMEYYSDFTGTWNGKEMENINGEIKIPPKLERYLEYPIQKILVQPAYYNVGETKVDKFKVDTLEVNKVYRLGGEIIKILDKKPIIQTRIKKGR